MKLTEKNLKKIITQELNRYNEEKLTESPSQLQRWEVYIDGEKKPFVVSGKDQRAAKKIAHAMTYPAKINTNIGKIELFESTSTQGKDVQNKIRNRDNQTKQMLSARYDDLMSD